MGEAAVAEVGKKWAPTPRQRRFLEEAAQAGLKRSIAVVAKAADVPIRTVYNWLDHPDFRKAYEDVPRAMVARHLPGALAAVVIKAQKGDVKAARLLCDVAGLLKGAAAPAGLLSAQNVQVNALIVQLADPARLGQVLDLAARHGLKDLLLANLPPPPPTNGNGNGAA